MGVHILEREQALPEAPADVFRFFGDAWNLAAITPPWLGFEVLTPRGLRMRPGAGIEYRLRLHGLPLRWRTEIAVWEPPYRFVDVQLRGPYRLWHHTHEFSALADGGTLMRDVVRYALALGALGELAHAVLVRRDLERIFSYRREAIVRLLPRDGA